MNDLERDQLLVNIDKKLDSHSEHLVKIEAVMFNTNGNEGLCSQVSKLCDKIDKHSTSIRNLWIAIVAIGGGAGGTVGIAKLVQILGG